MELTREERVDKIRAWIRFRLEGSPGPNLEDTRTWAGYDGLSYLPYLFLCRRAQEKFEGGRPSHEVYLEVSEAFLLALLDLNRFSANGHGHWHHSPLTD